MLATPKIFKENKSSVSSAREPRVSRGVFIAWAVGHSRNRANWHLTPLKRLRNVLRLITALSLDDDKVVGQAGSGRAYVNNAIAYSD